MMRKPGFRALIPSRIPVSAGERLRVAGGVLLGIAIMGVCSRFVSGAANPALWMFAPLGASAFLVFVMPSSPLAQPWPVIGGNLGSAAIGMLAAAAIPDPTAAAAIAVAVAVLYMFALRCLHPPGGAMALVAILLHAGGADFPLPLGALDCIVLVAAAIAYHRATGWSYPHLALTPADPIKRAATRLRDADIDAALARYNQFLDVERDELDALIEAAQREGNRRRMGEVRCSQVMTPHPVFLAPDALAGDARRTMHGRGIKALPVLDPQRRLLGIVTLANLAGDPQASGAEHVEQLMTRTVRTVKVGDHAMDLAEVFSETGHHHIPVVEDDGRLAGIVTLSDFLGLLMART